MMKLSTLLSFIIPYSLLDIQCFYALYFPTNTLIGTFFHSFPLIFG